MVKLMKLMNASEERKRGKEFDNFENEYCALHTTTEFILLGLGKFTIRMNCTRIIATVKR